MDEYLGSVGISLPAVEKPSPSLATGACEPSGRSELRAIVQAATSGPWNYSRTMRYVKNGVGAPWVCEVDCANPQWEANARFIATFNPLKVWELLDRIDDLERAVSRRTPEEGSQHLSTVGEARPAASETTTCERPKTDLPKATGESQ